MEIQGNKSGVEYPTHWEYKIIGSKIEDMIKAAEEIVAGQEYDITPSNISRNGKYFSLNITVLVQSETLRDIIFQKFTKHPDIKVVI